MFTKIHSRHALAAAFVLTTSTASATISPRAPEEPVDPAEVLYAFDEVRPAETAGWYFNDVTTAYSVALDSGRPLVLVLGEDWCKWCNRNVNLVLVCREINQFADSAVFAYSDPREDEVAEALMERLEIDSYPALQVIQPDPESLDVRFTMIGFFGAQEVGQDLVEKLGELGAKPDVTGFGPALTRKMPAADGACQG